jgi:hypothetical protein
MGAGQLAHYALAADANSIEPLSAALKASGLPASPAVKFGPDRKRFSGFATQDPDGHPVLVASVNGGTSYDHD